MEKPTTAFVLGAGLGTRLRPLTDSTPKPMLEVRGRPLIERIFDSLAAAGISRIIVNTHHAAWRYAERFASGTHAGAELEFVHEPELLDTGGGLKNVLDRIDFESGAAVYNGDIFSGIDMRAFLDSFASGPDDASLVLRRDGPCRNVSVRGGRVCDIRFLLGAQYDAAMQFSGIFAARGEFLKFVEEFPRSRFSTVEAISGYIARGGSVGMWEDSSFWSDIGTPEEYERLK